MIAFSSRQLVSSEKRPPTLFLLNSPDFLSLKKVLSAAVKFLPLNSERQPRAIGIAVLFGEFLSSLWGVEHRRSWHGVGVAEEMEIM